MKKVMSLIIIFFLALSIAVIETPVTNGDTSTVAAAKAKKKAPKKKGKKAKKTKAKSKTKAKNKVTPAPAPAPTPKATPKPATAAPTATPALLTEGQKAWFKDKGGKFVDGCNAFGEYMGEKAKNAWSDIKSKYQDRRSQRGQ